jgi:hypothetical protein
MPQPSGCGRVEPLTAGFVVQHHTLMVIKKMNAPLRVETLSFWGSCGIYPPRMAVADIRLSLPAGRQAFPYPLSD